MILNLSIASYLRLLLFDNSQIPLISAFEIMEYLNQLSNDSLKPFYQIMKFQEKPQKVKYSPRLEVL